MTEAIDAVNVWVESSDLAEIVVALQTDFLKALWRRLPAPIRTIVTWVFEPTALFRGLRTLFKLLPQRHQAGIYTWIQPTGFHHCLSYLANYRWTHRPEHFAPSILSLRDEYWQGDEQRKSELSDRFVHLVEAFVLRNGVKKTTSFSRHTGILSRILPALKLPGEPITVLDIPSSIGIASLANYDALSTRWPIGTYVLGDLCFEIVYDGDRECVFDGEGDLLQVRGWRGFFSVYRPAFSSGRWAFLSTLFLLPLHLRSWYTKRKYKFVANDAGTPILVVHPEVEKRVRDGIFHLRKTDVFSTVEGKYDLILSFNLLATRYFPQERIEIGIANLSNALREGGALVVGLDDSYRVFQKMSGQLVLVENVGEL